MKPRSNPTLTAKRLRELVAYDSVSGILTWRAKRTGRCKVGTRLGTLRKDGYREAKVDGVCYLEHVLVWLYVKGRYPTKYLDHKNRLRSDNRFSNLRQVPRRAFNHANSCGRRVGIPKGVQWHEKARGWAARITVDGKSRYLGFFREQADAAKAYEMAAKKHFGEFACFDIRGDL
jgi:hypothetical protein